VFPPDQTAELSTAAGRAPPRAEVAAAAADSIVEGRSEYRPPAKVGVWEEGAVINDRYTLERRLGSGSMGEVFLASDRLLKKHVALKVLRKDLAKSRATVRRFLREVALAHSVTHPNVVRIYDTGEADGLPYFSMEYLQGQTLDELIHLHVRGGSGEKRESEAAGRSDAPAMTLREIREISHEILSGLAAAHDAGIVHRDLKPANVMLTHRGAIVMDFGVAGFDTPGEGERPNPAEARSLVRTEAGTIFGSPAYMAPELWEGAPATVQTDLYSFGVMLYQMLTGRLPIEAPNAKVFLVKLREEKPMPVRQLRKDTPWNLALLVARCMRTEPEKRPVSAAAAAKLVSPLSMRLRWLAAGLVAIVAIVATAFALRGPKQRRWVELGLPDRVAVADLDAFVRSFDIGDYATALGQLERLEARAPKSAALVFWRATLMHELGDESQRWSDCQDAGYDPENDGEGWEGSESWRELAQRACAASYSLATPLRSLLDPDEGSKLPESWLPLAVSESLVPRLEAQREAGPALSREAEYVLGRLVAPHEFRDGPVLALRWQLARMELEIALGNLDHARSTLDTALQDHPGAPLAMARAAWFYTLLDDRERAEAWARAVEFDDPRPSIRLLLDEGRLRDAMARIDEYSTRPGRRPHRQALLDMWCGYAYRFQIEHVPLRCAEMSPGLVRNLWQGARSDAADSNAMSALERAISSQQAAINRDECLSRGHSTAVIGMAPPSFETYLRQLDIAAALCLSGRDTGPDLELARDLAEDLLAHTPGDPWALLFGAQVDDRYGRTGDALDKRQRVARRWAKADADLPLVVDLRKILDEPEEPAIAPPSEPTIEIEGERVSGDDGVEP
jgi:tRNA A-37 threonylcarbamoyl transferase component Bud32/tetratricopeptide (TPR) repeat protein